MERQTKGNTMSPFLNFVEAGNKNVGDGVSYGFDKNVGVGIYKNQIMAMLSWFLEWPKRGLKGCGGGPEIFPFHPLPEDLILALAQMSWNMP